MSQQFPQHEAGVEAQPKFPTGTLVFGLILLVVGALLLAGLLFGIQLNGPLLFIGLLGGAGLILVISGIVAARRTR
ncbi:hypothetical protein ACFY5D_06285 [Paeniglutamicibacter sp. NPDC012692]|uniref:hypothetical protein n=1 Tax=Paeniglutamicibacter sp. NPDC012692 TaxID=3364388 RepID=UPI0036BF35B8